MLADHPILFNADAVPWPNPGTWQEEPQTVETTGVTEAGTDQIILIRSGKFKASGTWDVSSRWAARFRAYSLMDQIAVSVYDGETYQVHQCRVRDYRHTLAANSERVTGTEGLYTVSFTLLEF